MIASYSPNVRGSLADVHRYQDQRQLRMQNAMNQQKLALAQQALGSFAGGAGSASSSVGGGSTAGSAGGYGDLSAQMLGELRGSGQNRRDEINRAYDTSLDASLGNLIDRGWGNSSLVESTQGATERNRQYALNNLDDQMVQQRVGVMGNVGLAGLQAGHQQQMANTQFRNQMLGGLLSSLFG